MYMSTKSIERILTKAVKQKKNSWPKSACDLLAAFAFVTVSSRAPWKHCPCPEDGHYCSVMDHYAFCAIILSFVALTQKGQLHHVFVCSSFF